MTWHPKKTAEDKERDRLNRPKKKPPAPIDNTFIYTYIAKRELFTSDDIYFPQFYEMTREQYQALSPADQLKAIGVKSGRTAKIYTEAEDKANKASKHAEITLQAQFCTWVKANYPNIKFLRHEREKKRGHFSQNQMQVLNSAGSMPDWETTETTDKYAGLLIEFKRPGEKWLMADGETIKTEYAHQYHCHVGLWKQRRVVYFCNDIEIAKLIMIQYLAGRNMRQRIYKYPEKLKHLVEM
jgi:hypothetical protein